MEDQHSLSTALEKSIHHLLPFCCTVHIKSPAIFLFHPLLTHIHFATTPFSHSASTSTISSTMPNYYSRPEGLFSPHTLWADDWIWRHDHGTLSPELECLGFKTYVHISPPHPDLTCEETYISKFRYHWNAAAIEFQRLETLFLEEVRKRSVGNKRQALEDSGWAVRLWPPIHIQLGSRDFSQTSDPSARSTSGLPSLTNQTPKAWPHHLRTAVRRS